MTSAFCRNVTILHCQVVYLSSTHQLGNRLVNHQLEVGQFCAKYLLALKSRPILHYPSDKECSLGSEFTLHSSTLSQMKESFLSFLYTYDSKDYQVYHQRIQSFHFSTCTDLHLPRKYTEFIKHGSRPAAEGGFLSTPV